jgi:redox-sensing transcriptional repressor
VPSARRIPEATVARLPLYYRALLETADQHVGTVSSERLASLAGVNAAKVRKDLSYLGSTTSSSSSIRSPASSASPTTGPS